MKKKILALVCAAVMVVGMSVTVLAAPSPDSGSLVPGSGNTSSGTNSGNTSSGTNSGNTSSGTNSGNTSSGTTSGNGSSSATSQDVANNNSGSSNSSTTTINVGSKQTITAETLSYFAKNTTVEGGIVTAVSEAIAREAVNEALQIYGENTFIAAIVDINVPGATFPYELTINCKDVWAGQTVTILHKAGDQWERLSPSKVADNSVTVTVNSFSPFAIVVDTNPSPRTGDISLMVSGLTGLFAAGTVFTGRKKRR